MKKFLTCSTLLLFFNFNLIAQSFDSTWAYRFQTVLDSVIFVNAVKGAAVSVYTPSEGLWTGVTGISTPGIDITDEMRFGIASNTKLFIAVILAKLQEQNILSLDDHLHQWIPSYPNVDSTITIRQLLSHQSGVYDFLNDNFTAWYDSVMTDTTRIWTLPEILATIGAPHFITGHGFSYSNTNYILAAMVIESATGNSWVQNLHDIILDPLNLDSTFAGALEVPNGPVAIEWLSPAIQFANSPVPSIYSSASAAGCMFSTSAEMVQWYNALFSGVIISDSSLREILDVETTSLYGLGITSGMYHYELANLNFSHSGGMLGYLSYVLYDVQTKSIICILTNSISGDFNDILSALFDVLYDEYPKKQNDAGIKAVITPWQNNCTGIISPAVTLKNFGSTTLTTVNINYAVDNGTGSTFNWSGSLLPQTEINVVLPSINVIPGNHTFKCYTSLPNGATEGYLTNDTSVSDFIVTLTVPSQQLLESFEGNVFPPEGWSQNFNSVLQWGTTPLAVANGSYSAVKNNYFDPQIGTMYDLDMPLLNTSGFIHTTLQFSYAYAPYPGSYDSLEILISTDCGNTWQTIFYDGGSSLSTAPATTNPFYPANNQWGIQAISLDAFTGEILVRFRNICGFGNNLYLDQVSIYQGTSTEEILSGNTGINVYPNPSSYKVTIDGLPVNGEVLLTDIHGKILYSAMTLNSSMNIDLGDFPKGIYLLITQKGSKKIVKI